MNELKKKLFVIISSIVLLATLVIVGYSVHTIKINEQMNKQAYEYNLQLAMQFIEDALTDIENMLIATTQKDENLKTIIKSTTSLERRLTLIKKKNEFKMEIRKYHFLDGLFLYDTKQKIYVGEIGNDVNLDVHAAVKRNVNFLVDYFESGQMNNNWAAIPIEGKYYLIRMVKTRDIYVCSWIQPEHFLQKIDESNQDSVLYYLCDSTGQILTHRAEYTKLNQRDDIVLLEGKQYHYFVCNSSTRALSMIMLVEKNQTNTVTQMAVISALIILCLGILIMLTLWILIKSIFFEPLDMMMLKKTLKENKAKLQFLQLQLNPHFLNNCLSLIRNLILFQQYEEAEEATIILGDYTRASFQPDIMILVEKELALIESWYHLQKMRLKNRITVQISLDEGMEQELIPSMLLYTFVENAAKHNVKRGEMLEINVSGHYVNYVNNNHQETYMEFLIQDHGQGFDISILECLKKGQEIIDQKGLKHIGISSMIQRLDILYEEKAIVEIKHHGEWVCITHNENKKATLDTQLKETVFQKNHLERQHGAQIRIRVPIKEAMKK